MRTSSKAENASSDASPVAKSPLRNQLPGPDVPATGQSAAGLRAGSASSRSPSAVWSKLALLGYIFGLLAVALEFYLLYSPAPPAGPSIPNFDKVAHLSMFGAPVFFLLWTRLPAKLVVAVFVAHAALSEVIQWRFIPTRDGSPFDFMADCVGIALAIVVHRLVRRWLARRLERSPVPTR